MNSMELTMQRIVSSGLMALLERNMNNVAEDKLTIDELRRMAGLKKAALAREAGVSVKTLDRIDLGLSTTEETINRLLRVLNNRLSSNYRADDIKYTHR